MKDDLQLLSMKGKTNEINRHNTKNASSATESSVKAGVSNKRNQSISRTLWTANEKEKELTTSEI